MLEALPFTATRLAYKAQQAAIRVPVLRAQRLVRRLTDNPAPRDRALAEAVRRRYDELLERELDNVEQGFYPARLLFQMPVAEYAKALPRFVADLPRSARRARLRAFRDLPDDVALESYPDYYRRTFHWQTDGYLSRRSAELYDVGVELLFLGAADVMRRQVMPPLARHFAAHPVARPRILDVACGGGSTLRQLAGAFPGARLHGLDLSPYYLELARARLPGVSFVAENAESMPYRDGWFDAVVSVHLFHELPKDARRNVLAEIRRVLAPGGALVIEDSAQLSDAPEIAGSLETFGEEMHEPYYLSYIRDDLATMLEETGFEVDAVAPCFVAKVVSAKKPR